MTDFRGVLRRLLQELALHPINVRVDAQAFAMFSFQARVFLLVHKFELADIEYFLPTGIHAIIRIRTEQPVKACLKGVFAPPPACCQSSRILAHFENFHVISGFACIDRGAESRYATADDYNFLGLHTGSLV